MNREKRWPPHGRLREPCRPPARPTPTVLQPKAAATQVKKAPAAPPVYRPLAQPKVLQKKSYAPGPPEVRPQVCRPAAPHGPRPQNVPKVTQAKPPAAVRLQTAAPARLLPSRPAATRPPSAPRAAQPKAHPGVIHKTHPGGVIQRMMSMSDSEPERPIATLSRYALIDVLRNIDSFDERIRVVKTWVLAQGDIAMREREGEMADLLRIADRSPFVMRTPAPTPTHVLQPPSPIGLPVTSLGGPASMPVPSSVPVASALPVHAPQSGPSAFDALMDGQQKLERWHKICAESGTPREPYSRVAHYGNTPTAADRLALGAGPGQVVDHDPPLVVRYYEGDPRTGERAGHLMSQGERLLSAADRSRMRVHSDAESRKQGDEMAKYSNEMRVRHYHIWKIYYGPSNPNISPSMM